VHWPREAVAATRHGSDRRGAEQLAQSRDLHLQIVFFHDKTLPRSIEQRVFRDDAFVPLDESNEHVECSRTQRSWLPTDQHDALGRPDFDIVEAEAFGQCAPSEPHTKSL